MEQQDRVKKYAESLEKQIQSTHYFLKKTVEDFQEKCKIISPEKSIPRDMIVGLRETYKEIREKLTEIKAIQQLLKGRYRQFARHDPTRDKELLEIGFLAKTCYSKFEYTLMQNQARTKAKERAKTKEKAKEQGRTERADGAPPFSWFKSEENRVIFLETLQVLKELDQEIRAGTGEGNRREKVPDVPVGGQSLTLFVIKGEPQALDELQLHIQLREQDILERTGPDELRGALTHLREVDASEVEGILLRATRDLPSSNLKCLLWRVQSEENLSDPLLSRTETTLAAMAEGEMKTLSI